MSSQPAASTSVGFLKERLNEEAKRENIAKKAKISATPFTDEELLLMTKNYQYKMRTPQRTFIGESMNKIVPTAIVGLIDEYVPYSRCNLECAQFDETMKELPVACSCLATFFYYLVNRIPKIYYKKEKIVKEAKINHFHFLEGHIGTGYGHRNVIDIILKDGFYVIKINSGPYDDITIDNGKTDFQSTFNDLLKYFQRRKKLFKFNKITEFDFTLEIPKTQDIPKPAYEHVFNYNDIVIDFGHPLTNFIVKRCFLDNHSIQFGRIYYDQLTFTWKSEWGDNDFKSGIYDENVMEIKSISPVVQTEKSGGTYTNTKKLNIKF